MPRLYLPLVDCKLSALHLCSSQLAAAAGSSSASTLTWKLTSLACVTFRPRVKEYRRIYLGQGESEREGEGGREILHEGYMIR